MTRSIRCSIPLRRGRSSQACGFDRWPWLDKSGGSAMTGRMISFGSGGAVRSLKALKRELIALQKSCTQLWGEMGAQEQEIIERKMSRAPTVRAIKRHDVLRARYWAAETRRMQLRGLIAERSAPGDDLP